VFERQEWIAIVRRLIRLTELRKISWTLNDKGALIAPVGRYEYVVRPQDWDGLPPWVLAVIPADDASTALASLTSFPGDAEEDPAAMLFTLREVAHREATGADQLARKLIEDLDYLEPDDDDV
jgi:hypothetical protein